MAISFVAAGTVIQGANPTVPVPAGYAAGDFFLMFVTAAIVTTPTGWTSLSSTTVGGPTNLFYKTASASESSVAVTSSNAATIAGMVAYRGTSGIDVQMISFNTSASATSLATTSRTTTQANDYVISYYGCSNIVDVWTAPASTTTRVTSNSTLTFRGALLVDELQASAGATTARTATLSIANGISAYAFAIKETAASTVNSNFFLLMQ